MWPSGLLPAHSRESKTKSGKNSKHGWCGSILGLWGEDEKSSGAQESLSLDSAGMKDQCKTMSNLTSVVPLETGFRDIVLRFRDIVLERLMTH